MNQKVSIIIPVYNVENYLKKCVSCLEEQTYRNLNIILIDDGSTDSSGAVCDNYAKKYKNITVRHQKNKGVSSARNYGLLEADGDYITFLDPDDWIDSNYIGKCMLAAEKNNFPDLLFTPYCREYGSKSIKNKLFKVENNLYFDQKLFLNKFYLDLFGRDPVSLKNPAIMNDLSPVWSKFYKKKLVDGIKFVDIKKVGSEDLWFNINALYRAHSALYINDSYYHYNKQNDGSLTRNYKAYLETGWGRLFRLLRLFVVENKLGNIYSERLNVRQGFAVTSLLHEVVADTLNIKQKLDKMSSLLNNDLYINCLKKYDYGELSMKWKIFKKLCLNKNVYSLYILLFCLEPLKKYLK